MDLNRVADGIFYSDKDDVYDQPCLFAAVGARRTLMVDGGITPERAREFIMLLERETGRGVDFAAVTHWHWDHVFGLPGVGAPVIACAETAKHLQRMAGYASWSDAALEARVRSGVEIEACAANIRKNYPGEERERIAIRLPDIMFETSLALDLGGLTCRLTRLPVVHTNDCVAIEVQERGVLILGDCMYGNSYDRPAHYSAKPVLEMLSFIRGTGARLFLESHVGVESAGDFWAYARILEAAASGALQGITDEAALVSHMERQCGGPHEDAAEIAALFIAGIEYDKQNGRGNTRE